jgi:hypothetical protein
MAKSVYAVLSGIKEHLQNRAESSARPALLLHNVDLVEAYCQGLTLKEVGALFGVSHAAAWQQLKRNRIPRRLHGRDYWVARRLRVTTR